MGTGIDAAIPTVMVDDDPDTQRGLELLAEAERGNQRARGSEPAAAKAYQLDSNTFTPKTGKHGDEV